jgi:hypothetical protein
MAGLIAKPTSSTNPDTSHERETMLAKSHDRYRVTLSIRNGRLTVNRIVGVRTMTPATGTIATIGFGSNVRFAYLAS